ncbi:MAG: stage II sporulation protein M [Oscillospiraceae bacterium]|jgi:stage II sporulation protein M|nr:stage II sporulation protein M [Oscillospiraceae bacterium]
MDVGIKRMPVWHKTRAYILENFGFLLMCTVLLIGLLIGASAVRAASHSEDGQLNGIASSFIVNRGGMNFTSVMLKSFASAIMFLIAFFVLGNCNFGFIVIPFLLAFRGVGLGTSLGYIYSLHGAKGLAYCAILIIPPALLSSLALVLAAKSSMSFSVQQMKKLRRRSTQNTGVKYRFEEYGKGCLLCLLMLLVSSLLDAGLNAAFARFFVFA